MQRDLMKDMFCGLLSDKNGVFGNCLKKMNALWLDNCKYDVCSNQDNPKNAKEAACGSLQAFNAECSNLGASASWRTAAGCRT